MLPKLQDMARTPEEMKEDMPMGIVESGQPIYPWGLTIRLSDKELEKLNLDDDCEIGDFIHLFALAKVTSVSTNDTASGKTCCVELQITHLGVESEDEEDEEAEEEMPAVQMAKKVKVRLYK
jgi:hypothetical protein